MKPLQIIQTIGRRIGVDFVGCDRGEFTFSLSQIHIVPSPEAITQNLRTG